MLDNVQSELYDRGAVSVEPSPFGGRPKGTVTEHPYFQEELERYSDPPKKQAKGGMVSKTSKPKTAGSSVKTYAKGGDVEGK